MKPGMQGYRGTGVQDDLRRLASWPGYAVTVDGRVFSYRQRRGPLSSVGAEPRPMAVFDRRDNKGALTGYLSVCLYRDGRHTNVYVHDLVLTAFVGARPSPDHEALHWNSERGDNRLANLRWGTAQENADDRKRCGTVYSGERWHLARQIATSARDGGFFDDLLAAGAA